MIKWIVGIPLGFAAAGILAAQAVAARFRRNDRVEAENARIRAARTLRDADEKKLWDQVRGEDRYRHERWGNPDAE